MDKIKIPFSEFSFSFARSSGAGGQNVNKVNSKVTLNWKINETVACSPAVIARFRDKYGQFILDSGEVQIVSQKNRSQKANMDDCIEKLHAMMNEVLHPPKIRKKNQAQKKCRAGQTPDQEERLRKKKECGKKITSTPNRNPGIPVMSEQILFHMPDK